MQIGVDNFFVLQAAGAMSATVAVFLVLARKILGECYCKRHLPYTGCAIKQVTMTHAVVLVRLHEPALDFVLSYYVLESHFAKFENKLQI